ncbi:hypothetical protein F5B20DRAFT_593697 [Whalleya microplaca]|nr:hypothetical protein F5B20DRAFT_593697 [Whalleya microplaca]
MELAIPTPLTFSVELQAHVAYYHEFQFEQPPKDRNGAAPILIPSEHNCEPSAGGKHLVDTIKQGLRDIGCRVFPDAVTPCNPINISLIHPEYYSWDVEFDMEAKDMPEGYENHLGLSWTGIRIKSPAMWACHTNFDEVARVFREIKKVFILLSTQTCDLSVLVRRGDRPFDLFELQRIAGLCYASSSLLSMLHDRSRHESSRCLSNRFYSELAIREFRPKNDEEDSLNEEYITSTSESARAVPTVDSGFVRIIPRGTLQPEPFNLDIYKETTRHYQAVYGQNRMHAEPLGIIPAVGTLLECTEQTRIADLMNHITDRTAYKFLNYIARDENIKRPWNKTAVEFCQARGTLDVDSIVLWVKICVRLSIFAIDEGYQMYRRLIRQCARAERAPQNYDALDLLLDVGLVDEAAMLQSQILRRNREAPWQMEPRETTPHHS